MSRLIQILLLCLFSMAVHAQQNTVVAGGDASGKTGSFSYSVGQALYLGANAEEEEMIAGMQQPADDEAYDYNKMCDNVQITITPNPTPDYISVYLNDDFAKYRYVLTDAMGKFCTEGEFSDGYEKLDLLSQTNGVYMLRVYCTKDESVVFKIIKRR